MGPRPTSVCLKEGMTYPVVGKSLASWGMGRSAVAVDCSGCPLATPTVMRGAVVSMLVVGAFGAMYMWEAPESTIAVLEEFRIGGVGLLRTLLANEIV